MGKTTWRLVIWKERTRENRSLVQAHLKSFVFAANLKASIRKHDENKEEISGKLGEANQMNEELTGLMPRLQTEQASLRSANSQLEKVRHGSLKLHMARGQMTSRAGDAASEKTTWAGSTLAGNPGETAQSM